MIPAEVSARSRAPMSVRVPVMVQLREQRCRAGEQRLVVLAERDQVAVVDREVPPGQPRPPPPPPATRGRRAACPPRRRPSTRRWRGRRRPGRGRPPPPPAGRPRPRRRRGRCRRPAAPAASPARPVAGRIARHPGSEHAVAEPGGDGAAPGAVRGDQHGDVGRETGREAGRLQQPHQAPVPAGLLAPQQRADRPDVLLDFGPAHRPLPQQHPAGQPGAEGRAHPAGRQAGQGARAAAVTIG